MLLSKLYKNNTANENTANENTDTSNINSNNIDSVLEKVELNIELNIKKTSALFTLSIVGGILIQLLNVDPQCKSQQTTNCLFRDKYKDLDLELNQHIADTEHKLDLESNKAIINFELKDLEIWANIFGYAFQISDDILDFKEDSEKGNPNICSIIGLDVTKKLLQLCCNWLLNTIYDIFDSLEDYNPNLTINIHILHTIINQIFNRTKTVHM